MRADRPPLLASPLALVVAVFVGVGNAPVWAGDNVLTVLAPIDWPVESAIKRTLGQRQAVLFLNPHEYQARLVLNQALEVSVRSGAPFTVCFAGPADAKEAWYDTPLVGTARRLGFHLHFDTGGKEAERFGAATAGVCAAYDARGRLSFYGDIAPSGPGYSKEDGVNAAMQGLSRIRAKSDHLFLCPITGGPLMPPAAE